MAILIHSAKTDFETKRRIEAPLGQIGFDSCTSVVDGGFVIDNDICTTAKALGRYQAMKDILRDNGVEFVCANAEELERYQSMRNIFRDNGVVFD